MLYYTVKRAAPSISELTSSEAQDPIKKQIHVFYVHIEILLSSPRVFMSFMIPSRFGDLVIRSRGYTPSCRAFDFLSQATAQFTLV